MKHKRANHRKSRTGCITCKIRHVKCDEQKPECQQCTKTGRKCDGYDPNRTNPQAEQKNTAVEGAADVRTQLGVDQRLVLRPGTREERRYIDFFSTQTSRALAGFFNSNLWRSFLPQLSHSQAAVRHAVVALGALHEYVYVLLARGDFDPRQKLPFQNEQFIVQQYNQAIRHLVVHLASPNQVPHLTLITCCLFICLEILRGQHDRALDHIESGLKILRRWQPGDQRQAQSDGLGRELSYMGIRWNIQLSMYGRQMISLDFAQADDAAAASQQISFSTIAEARHALDLLINRTMSFIQTLGTDTSTQGALWQQQQQQQQHSLQEEMKLWLDSFESLMRRYGQSQKQNDPRAPVLLRMHHRVVRLRLDVCLSQNELVYDEHDEDFEATIAYAEQLIHLSGTLDRDSLLYVFSLETGLISPLYYTATKCRKPLIRRQAIRLLYRSPQKEGLWSMRQYARIAQVVVQAEEEHMGDLPVDQRIPVDNHRAYSASIENRTCQSCRLILMRKPEGCDAAWRSDSRHVNFVGEDIQLEGL
ncbi:uncharacterized protein ACLA_008320 [Aspergillus clavatus NRRL 1]|uniref:C6 zinc finger domain protein n=1 Tax=Aspergillus clavatus (strain ATCC 1007 / CBS 513.65 / DSM 816 / NCTC 3887 / NRRL 1 / QM 1276 / 107) TaxID=344612 RepID=A1CDZ5_ASPCL|nr:C6 zinc finger domain protein [Aspergillus clavatus NRRL 1]EAW12072.1 C6 zinc finger domain protein [Aspergillus clavatus NRRL 1]